MSILCSAIFFILVNCFCNHCFGQNVTQQLLEDSGTIVNNSSDGVSETQHARCHISTEELVANAETSVTRVLTGVCNAEVVDGRFKNLELMIKREFDEIKQTLNSMMEYRRKNFEIDVDPRQEEIDRFNNTVNTINSTIGVQKTFSYFIRFKDFDQRVSLWGSGRFTFSNTFYLPLPSRYAMYVKVTPGEFNRRTTYVKIGAGLRRGIDDETLDWPFILKHQIEILDHSQSRRDIRAPIVDPLTSGSQVHWGRPSIFGRGENPELTSIAISANVILTDDQPQSNSVRNIARYLWNGDLIVKLTVYL